MSKQLRIVFNDEVTQAQVDSLVAAITNSLEVRGIVAVIFGEDVDYEEGDEDEQAG